LLEVKNMKTVQHNTPVISADAVLLILMEFSKAIAAYPIPKMASNINVIRKIFK